MSREGDTINIGDWQYRLDRLPYKHARKVARRIVVVMASAKEGGMGAALAELDDDVLEWLSEIFGKSTLVRKADAGGDKGWLRLDEGMRDVVFASGLSAWMKWLRACLELNFADFLDELKRLKAEVEAEEEKASPSQSTSTGSSGESSAQSDSAAGL